MTSAALQDPGERARARLQQSRLAIVLLAEALKGNRRHGEDDFPRSFIMRAATGRGGRLVGAGGDTHAGGRSSLHRWLR